MTLEELTQEEIELIKDVLTIKNELDKYVILREDENGKRYIEYAFQEGAPINNDCLSWYDKFQPKALKRNKHDFDKWKNTILKKPNHIYYLSKFNCGNDTLNYDNVYHCDVGSPSKECLMKIAKKWSYDEPIKCACWVLSNVNLLEQKYELNLEQIKKLKK